MKIPTVEEMKALARQKAAEYGINPELFVAQLQQESQYNPKAISPAGAVGVAQLMPRTARSLGVNPRDPIASIDAAARMMARLKERYKGDEDLARQAYNWGTGNMTAFLAGRKKMPKETSQYNDKIYALAGRKAQASTPTTPRPELTLPPPAELPPMAQAPRQPSELLATAFREMNQDLPAGTLLSQMVEPAQTASEQPGMEWLRKLQTVQPPEQLAAAPAEDWDMVGADEAQAQAQASQERLMARMFSDGQEENVAEDTSILPSAVDRYLERVLAA